MNIKTRKTLITIFIITLTIFILSATSSFAQVIQTGDSQATSVVENHVNTVIRTCCSPTPTQGPTPTPAQENTPTPTQGPTPTPGPSDNNGGSSGSGGGDGRSDGLSSCPECTKAPVTKQVLGLSTTSSNGNLLTTWIQFLLAFGLISTGALYLKKNA